MIPAFLLNLGLKALLPTLLGILLIGGGVGAWWVGWIDWPSLALGALGFGLLLALVEANNKLYKFAIVVLLVGLVYIKGRIDEHDNVMQKYESTILKLEASYKKDLDKVQADFKATYDAEKARQELAAKVAIDEANQTKKERTAEVLSLRSELQKVRKEAESAENAKRPALDADSVRRINRMRANRK